MPAKYYIYRNLTKKCFSVKYKGKVIAHPTELVAYNVTFNVSQSGREKVLATRQKNVHAYVVAESYSESSVKVDGMLLATYDPYKNSEFTVNGISQQGIKHSVVYMTTGKVYVR